MNTAMQARRRIHSGVAASTLLAMACFLSQTFVLPIFVYSFLALTTAVAWQRMRPTMRLPAPWREHFRGEFPRLALLLVFLMLAVVKTGSITSLIFLLTSLSCFFFVLLLDTQDARLKYRATQGFIIACVLLLLVGSMLLVIQQPREGLFQYSPDQGQFRFRGLNLEPNHLGFALGAGYLVVLFDPNAHFAHRRATRHWLIALIWLMSVLTASPFALATLVMVSVPYLWRSATGKIICALMLCAAFLLQSQSTRVEQILNGEDSSTNLRTWGSLVIAHLQLDTCGPLGCGLGNSRDVLAEEPLMRAFAAQETLVLPNLFAGSMVEGGYALLIFALLMIIFAAFPPSQRWYRPSAVSLAVFFLLFSFAASGSYPYDAQFWSTAGLLAALVRTSGTELPERRRRRPALDQPVNKDS